MKQCPKCNASCEDNDMVCKNCGYLFTPEGFNPNMNNQQPPVQPNQYQQPPVQNNWGDNYQQAPMQNGYANPYNAAPKNSGAAIASLVLGIISTVMGCCYGIGLLTAIPGIITGIIGIIKTGKSSNTVKGKGLAIAGLILSIVGMILALYFIITLIVNRDQIMDAVNKVMSDYDFSSYSN